MYSTYICFISKLSFVAQCYFNVFRHCVYQSDLLPQSLYASMVIKHFSTNSPGVGQPLRHCNDMS